MSIGDGWAVGSWIENGWISGAWLDTNTAIANLSGSVANGILEAEVVLGGDTLVITLVNDTWVAAGAPFNAQRQNILNGITGTTFIDDQPVTSVVRTSDTVVTITLVAVPAFDIAVTETGAVTVPATALAGAQAIVSQQTFLVSPDIALDWLDPSLKHKAVTRRHNRQTLRCKDPTLAHLS